MASGDASELRVGDTLAGRYRLVAPIGEGGMGQVWEARQLTTDKPVAIKVLKGGDSADAARFLREARVAAALTHRNIVQVFDFWEVDGGGPVFMVMELLRGQTLAQVLEPSGALTLAEALGVALPVAAALRAAHAQKIVHRDLKPENVFFARGGGDEPPEIKVLDFGLAKPFVLESPGHATALTQSGALLGTPYYMAPEQVYGEKNIDDRADIWALGVTLYECLSGARPFTGENFGQIFRRLTHGEFRPLQEAAPNAPPALVALVTRMMSLDRAHRPGIDEVYDALATLNAGEPAGPAQLTRAMTRRVTPFPHPPSPHTPPRSDAIPLPAAPLAYSPPPGAPLPLPHQPTVIAGAISVKRAQAVSPLAVAGIGLALVAVLAVGLGGFFALRWPARAKHVDIAAPALAPMPVDSIPAPATAAPSAAGVPPPAIAGASAPTASASAPPPAPPKSRPRPRATAAPNAPPGKDPLSGGRF